MSILDDQNVLRAIHRYVAACGGNTNEAEHGADAIDALRELGRVLDWEVEQEIEAGVEAATGECEEEIGRLSRELEEAQGETRDAKKALKQVRALAGDIQTLSGVA